MNIYKCSKRDLECTLGTRLFDAKSNDTCYLYSHLWRLIRGVRWSGGEKANAFFHERGRKGTSNQTVLRYIKIVQYSIWKKIFKNWSGRIRNNRVPEYIISN